MHRCKENAAAYVWKTKFTGVTMPKNE
ncbi:BnaC02g25580D [Brassica napus]|uniref:BnaC02g25580D protein n=1 Tax=Brassica napus TaxID=3708 RepID=A0A078GA47_BRANA|nr:BnaC02g25580D [Brassica napus]